MKKSEYIDFNRPFVAGRELEYITDAIFKRKALCGNGYYTSRCSEYMQSHFGVRRALLTASGTAALEMCAILLDIKPGDEVIMPSFTYVSTANAFVLRGAIPRFVDIRPDTMNMDEKLIEASISNRTKAIVVVHYAGISIEMDEIARVASNYGLPIVEDAAHAVGSKYKGRYAGSLGQFGVYSFHETKNIISGEGGGLLVNDPSFEERAEIVIEKGTNRKKYFEGRVDKYSWVDIGSSYVMSELNAAYLYGQLQNYKKINKRRISIFAGYFNGLRELQDAGLLRLPVIPRECQANGHIFYVLCKSSASRAGLMSFLDRSGIQAVFHYSPLHTSGYCIEHFREVHLPVTEDVAGRLLRLPLFYTMTDSQWAYVISKVKEYFAVCETV